MKRNESISWESFRRRYAVAFLYRRTFFFKFKWCTCLYIRGLPTLDDCYHYRYLPKTETRFRRAAGRNAVEWCDERLRRQKKKTRRPPRRPARGYQEEPRVLSREVKMDEKGCIFSEFSVRCIFDEQPSQRGHLAVLVTGIKDRYYPRSAFKHVVAPAARAGYRVDYHASYSWLVENGGRRYPKTSLKGYM